MLTCKKYAIQNRSVSQYLNFFLKRVLFLSLKAVTFGVNDRNSKCSYYSLQYSASFLKRWMFGELFFYTERFISCFYCVGIEFSSSNQHNSKFHLVALSANAIKRKEQRDTKGFVQDSSRLQMLVQLFVMQCNYSFKKFDYLFYFNILHFVWCCR